MDGLAYIILEVFAAQEEKTEEEVGSSWNSKEWDKIFEAMPREEPEIQES